jgi:hypothetical protein
MEFSSGLFSNLNIETQREVPTGSKSAAAAAAAVDPNMPPSEVVSFTIKASYARPNTQPNPAPTNQVAKK